MPKFGCISEINQDMADIYAFHMWNSIALLTALWMIAPVLVTLTGNIAYNTIRALCAPVAPSDKSVDKLVGQETVSLRQRADRKNHNHITESIIDF